jgi:hypothetical protein
LLVVEVLDKPLPKPSEESYVEARLLEALVEAHLALRFLRGAGESPETPPERPSKPGKRYWPRCYA